MEMDYIQISFNDERFNFDKINLVGIRRDGRLADKYKCTKTNLIGFRFGVSRFVSVPDNKKNRKTFESVRVD